MLMEEMFLFKMDSHVSEKEENLKNLKRMLHLKGFEDLKSLKIILSYFATSLKVKQYEELLLES